jgi:hypothetical protein
MSFKPDFFRRERHSSDKLSHVIHSSAFGPGKFHGLARQALSHRYLGMPVFFPLCWFRHSDLSALKASNILSFRSLIGVSFEMPATDCMLDKESITFGP